MKKYLSIFNIHSLLIVLICLVSSIICYYYKLNIYIDFLIMGIIIAFPLTFSLRVAFRRRERALQYLSLFKGGLQSMVYAFCDSKMEENKKSEIKNIAVKTSNELIDYLLNAKDDPSAVQKASHTIYVFVRTNSDIIKRRESLKILIFIFRINESIEFLMATKRHSTPWGPKALVLFAIYVFAIFYPASLLYKTEPIADLWYVIAMSVSKAFFLISFFNIQRMLENPFNQNSPDGIRVDDFRYVPEPEPIVIKPPKDKTEKVKAEESEDNDD